MNKYILLVVLLLSVSLSIKAQRNVSFIEEYIDFDINYTYFSINGIYTFANNGENQIKQRIVFPFAEQLSQIDSIRVINLNSFERIKFKKLKNAISFDFMVQANDTVNINIFYRQKTSKINKYIITTTQFWGKALNKAVYTLAVPLDIEIESFSFSPDSVETKKDRILYLWEKLDFAPTLDLEFIIKE